MANPGARGDDAEIVKRALTPFKELITLHISFIFAVYIHLERTRVAKLINHDRVVDDQIHRGQRVDFLCIATQSLDPVAHRSQVDHCGHAGEILHQHAGRAIGDLARVLPTVRGPDAEGLDVVDGHGKPVIFEPQQVFQNHLQRGGQTREIPQSSLLRARDRVIGKRRAPYGQSAAGLGGVCTYGDGHWGLPPVKTAELTAMPMNVWQPEAAIKGNRPHP